MSAQLAAEALGVGRVVAKINDPLRAQAYAELGIATLCRTGLMADAVNAYLGFPPSGLGGLLPPTGTHPGGDHDHDHERTAADAVGSDAAPAPAAGRVQEG
jgi:hypothetical protein